jgi:hypothetical protein
MRLRFYSAAKTPAYDCSSFGELTGRILGQWDEPINTDDDETYDIIRSHVTTIITSEGDYSVDGILIVEDTIQVASISSGMVSVGPGVVAFVLDFDGTLINSSGISGPYKLSLRVFDLINAQQGTAEFTTAAYEPGDFDESSIQIDGSPDTTTIDLGMNGFIDSLIFIVDFITDSARPIMWHGWLTDTTLQAAAAATIEYMPPREQKSGGSSWLPGTVNLSFAGNDIYNSGVSGPYILSYLLAADDSISIPSYLLFMTEDYSYDQFQQPPPPLVVAAGNFAEDVDDSNGNGFYDYLEISFDVVAEDSGTVTGNAVLTDGTDEDIQWASGSVDCQDGDTCRLEIQFDGLTIFNHGQDGPFHMKNLMVYHSGDPGQMYDDTSVYTTSVYLAADFEQTCCNTAGDANDDGQANIGDAVYLISHVFKGGPPPPCLDEGDANFDCGVNIGDAVYLISYVFKGGNPPECGCVD